MLATFSELGELYEDKLGWVNEAIDAYEAAQTLDPDNRERAEQLAELYATDPEKYLDKAVASQAIDPAPEPVPARVVQAARAGSTPRRSAPTPAWCLCQALYVLEPRRAGRGALLQAHARRNRGAARSRR